jgi:hypothetical protein
VVEAGEGVLQEALDDEFAGVVVVDAAGFEVEEFFVADGAAGAAVAAFDLVGIDFQAGHGVGLGFLAVDEVAAGLVGVGEVCAFIDGDETREDGAGGIVEGVFVKEVAAGVRSGVVLEGALIDDLGGGGQGDGDHVAAAALAEEVADALAAGEGGAELDLEGFDLGVAMRGGGGEMEGGGGVAEFLAVGVGDAATGLGDEVGDGATEGGDVTQGVVVIDDGDGGVVASDDEGVGEDGGVLGSDPVEDFDGVFDDDVFGDDDDDTRLDVGEVKGGEFGGAEGGLALHEVLLDDFGVFDEGIGEGFADDAFGEGVGVGLDELVVDEDEAGGGVGEADGGGDGFSFGGFGRGRGAVEGGGVETFGVGVAPVLVFDAWDGQGLEGGPGGGGAFGEPLREVGGGRGRCGGERGGSGEGVGHGNSESGIGREIRTN